MATAAFIVTTTTTKTTKTMTTTTQTNGENVGWLQFYGFPKRSSEADSIFELVMFSSFQNAPYLNGFTKHGFFML